mgnify:CR=1 FL=1
MCSKICHFLARKRNVPLRRNNIRSCLRKSVKLIQASFLIKGCDEMKTDKKYWIYSWLIYSNISFSNFIDNTFENWFLFLFVNSLALHFVIAVAIIGRMLSRFPVCFSFYLVGFFLVKCSWKNYKIWETYYLSEIFSRKIKLQNSLNVMQILFVKVHIFWEGHRILGNLYLTFDWHYIGPK